MAAELEVEKDVEVEVEVGVMVSDGSLHSIMHAADSRVEVEKGSVRSILGLNLQVRHAEVSVFSFFGDYLNIPLQKARLNGERQRAHSHGFPEPRARSR